MRKEIILFIYLLMLLASIIVYSFSDGYNEGVLESTLVGVIIALIVFTCRKESYFGLRKMYIRPLLLFLMSYLIVHFQLYFDIVFKNISSNTYYILGSESAISKAALLSLAGLLTFLSGYILYSPSHKASKINDNREYPLGPLIFFCYIFYVLFTYNVSSDYINGGYGGIDMAGSIAGYSEMLLQLFFYAVMIVNMRNKRSNAMKYSLLDYIKSYGLWFYIPFVMYVLMVLMSGSRSPVIGLIIGYFFAYIFITKKKIKLAYFILLLIAGAASITLLGIARRYSVDQLSFSEKLAIAAMSNQTETINSFSANTAELAGSVKSLHLAMAYVPEQHPYLDGLFMTKNIMSSVPFVSSVTSPLFDNSYKYRGSANFITFIEHGDNPDSGVGLGTTCVADIYLDFGLFGVIIVMGLFGMLIRHTEIAMFAYRDISLWNYILGFYLTITAIYLSRSSILLGIRSLIWLFVIIWSYQCLVHKYSRR